MKRYRTTILDTDAQDTAFETEESVSFEETVEVAEEVEETFEEAETVTEE